MYEFITEGMSCGSCVKHVTNAVRSVDSKAEVQVDLTLQKVTIISVQTRKELIEAIENSGYPILRIEVK